MGAWRSAARKPLAKVSKYAQLPLAEGGLIVGMDIFDGVFQGYHVHRLTGVDLFENGGQGGGLAGAGGAGEKDQAVLQIGHAMEDIGQVKAIDGRQPGLKQAQDRRQAVLLGEDVDPETGLGVDPVGHIAGTMQNQLVQEALVAPHEVQGKDLGLERGEFTHLGVDQHRRHDAVGLHLQGLASRDVQVGDARAGGEHLSDPVVDIRLFHDSLARRQETTWPQQTKVLYTRTA